MLKKVILNSFKFLSHNIYLSKAYFVAFVSFVSKNHIYKREKITQKIDVIV